MALFWIVHEKDGKRRILIQEGSTLTFGRCSPARQGSKACRSCHALLEWRHPLGNLLLEQRRHERAVCGIETAREIAGASERTLAHRHRREPPPHRSFSFFSPEPETELKGIAFSAD